MSLVRQLLDAAEAEIEAYGVSVKPTSLTISVGRLSGASPEAMRFAFELLAPRSRLAYCRLEIIEPPAVCRCAGCGAQTEIVEVAVSCPACGSFDVRIEGGRELRLEAMTLDDQATEEQATEDHTGSD